MEFKRLLFTTFFAGICMVACTCGQAKSINKTLSTAINAEQLAKHEGYLLMYINVEGSAASIEFSKINTKRDTYVTSTPTSFTHNYKIELKQITKGFYVIPLLTGVYQITRVNAPFYDLPYWLDTENKTKWRFAIEENHLNFIGEMYIAKERDTNNVDVHLLNRFATYQKQITNEFSKMISIYPLRLKPGYQDEYLIELEK